MSAMTCTPLEFSQKEESILSDVTNLAKKNVHQTLDLSGYLDQYMDLIHLMDVEEACNYLTLNFAKAGVLLENSTKVYCVKVDGVCISAEGLLDALKERSVNQKKARAEAEAGEEGDVVDEPAEVVQEHRSDRRRRGRRFREDLSEEDFVEVDNISDLSGNNMNETKEINNPQISFMEQTINLLVKMKKERKRLPVLRRADDKDDSKLKDWVLNINLMILRENFSSSSTEDFLSEDSFSDVETLVGGDGFGPPTPHCDDFDDNLEADGDLRRRSISSLSETLNRYQFRIPKRDILVDWNGIYGVQDLNHDTLGDKKPKPANVARNPCKLCDAKKAHKKKGKRCLAGLEVASLDSYFNPLAQPLIGDLQHGVLPNEELYGLYKEQQKIINRLAKKQRGALSDKLLEKDNGFEGFEEDDIRENDDASDIMGDFFDGNNLDLPLPNNDFLLPPLPAPEDNIDLPPSRNEDCEPDKLSQCNSAQELMERNKQLGLRIAAWHKSLDEPLSLSQQRGALDMDEMAGVVMKKFDKEPKLYFGDLVKGQNRKDIPRFFLACLQLTNEGNIDIERRGGRLSCDGMDLIRLRTTRVREELEGYDPEAKSPKKRSMADVREEMRNSGLHSDSDSDSDASGPLVKRKRANERRDSSNDESEESDRDSPVPQKKGKKRAAQNGNCGPSKAKRK